MLAGRYELLEILGPGSLGDVFLARNHMDGSEVAIKWLPRDPDARADNLLLREARILSQLAQHTTGVVTYRDFVQEHDAVYLVTERVRGVDLRYWQERRSQRDILGVYVHIASVLGTIHEAGFVHCDMKPTKAMVVENDGSVGVKIMDFEYSVETKEPDISN
jgi:serine/threonine protein kinase